MEGSELRKFLTDLWRIFWTHRSKAYTRIATALIGVGGLAASTSVGAIIVQAVAAAYGGAGDSTPWWATMLFGAALVAVGISIFFYFYRRDAGPGPMGPDHINMSLPPNFTFEQAVLMVGLHVQRAVKIEAFDASELNAILIEAKLRGSDAADLLRQLGALSVSVAIRNYDVLEQSGPIIVRRR